MDEKKGFLVEMAEVIDRHLPRRAERAEEPASDRNWLRWIGRQFVPNIGTLLLVAVLIVTQQVWAGPLLGTTNVPGPSATTVNYQGRLADNGGNPLDGIYGMTFALYDASTDGNLVWGPESHAAVVVSDGLFSVGLGSQTSGGIPTSVWNGDIYLEVTVSGETLEPRELIRSVPIAGMALTVPDGAIGSVQQTITTFQGADSTYVIYEGTDEQTVSEFSFSNVPAGDVTVFATLYAMRPTDAYNAGRITLRSVSTNETVGVAPTHPLSTNYLGSQVVLHGTIEDFPGGTLELHITVYGENDNAEFRFGVWNGDSRFARRITVIAGQ